MARHLYGAMAPTFVLVRVGLATHASEETSDRLLRTRDSVLLATSKSGTHWEPRDQGLDGGLVSSLRALL